MKKYKNFCKLGGAFKNEYRKINFYTSVFILKLKIQNFHICPLNHEKRRETYLLNILEVMHQIILELNIRESINLKWQHALRAEEANINLERRYLFCR